MTEEERMNEYALESDEWCRRVLAELVPLANHLAKGRAKYPRGATVMSLMDEAGEVAHAVNKGEGYERIRSELLDTACVAMRLYLGEVDTGLTMDGIEQVRKEEACAHSLMTRRAWPECTCGGGNEIGSHLAKCAITDHKGHLAARTAGPGERTADSVSTDQEKKT